ncbi:MAG TPA: thiolase family protein [candidate division Zixibacteria bacterium]|nr:thiolase family protein [candidate division Zixibacteria bacterium]
MSIRGEAAIVGIGETPTDRLGSKPGEPRKSTAEYLAWAAKLAMEDAGLAKKDFEGQGLAAIYTTSHSQPFWPEEVASILGLKPGVSLAGGNGGASSVSLLGHAAAAIAAGLCDLVLVIAAASPFGERGAHRGAPADTRDYEMPFGVMGPNCKISFVMSRYMHESGMTAEHFGKIAVTARYHASLNPNAYLRKPITIEDYKKSRLISDPIRLFDCVLPANGGKAYIMASAERAKTMRKPPVYLLGWGECNNASYGPRYRSNPLVTGISEAGRRAFAMAGVTHRDIGCLNLYDDYIPIVMLQIEDLGFCEKNDKAFFERTDFTFKGDLPIQTGGGMINCGQPSTTGGMLHVIETVRQLRGEAGQRQVPNVRFGVATGLGAVNYGKNFGCTAAAVLGNER